MPGNANSLSISLPRHRGFSASTPPARSSSRSARCPATPLHCQSHYRDIAGPLRRHHTRLRAHARRDARRHHFTGKLTAEASRILQLGFSTSKPHARASLRSTRRSAILQRQGSLTFGTARVACLTPSRGVSSAVAVGTLIQIRPSARAYARRDVRPRR